MPACGLFRQRARTQDVAAELDVPDVQVGGPARHGDLRAAQEGQSAVHAASLPPHHHAHLRLGRRQVPPGRLQHIPWLGQRLHTRHHVRVLLPVCSRAPVPEVLVVEEVLDHLADDAVCADHRAPSASAVVRMQLPSLVRLPAVLQHAHPTVHVRLALRADLPAQQGGQEAVRRWFVFGPQSLQECDVSKDGVNVCYEGESNPCFTNTPVIVNNAAPPPNKVFPTLLTRFVPSRLVVRTGQELSVECRHKARRNFLYGVSLKRSHINRCPTHATDILISVSIQCPPTDLYVEMWHGNVFLIIAICVSSYYIIIDIWFIHVINIYL